MIRIALAVLSLCACEAPDPADAPAVELLPEGEVAAEPTRAAAIVPTGLPQATVAELPTTAGGCGQHAQVAAAQPSPSGGGCGQQAEVARAQPTGPGCAAHAQAAAGGGGCGGNCDGSCGQAAATGGSADCGCGGNCDGSCGQAPSGQIATTGRRPDLSAASLAKFGTPSPPRRGAPAGGSACGH